MPPSLRRTSSESSSSSNFYISAATFSLFGPWSLPANPVVVRTRSNRSHSVSYSPYPATPQAVERARTSNRSSERTRRVLGELDWWLVSNGQCDQRREEERFETDDLEWQSMVDEEEEQATESAGPIVNPAADTEDDVEDDTQSEHSDLSESSLVENDDNVSPITGSESTPEKEPVQRAPSPFFPITLPPLTSLLSSQIGFEPSRRSRFGSRNLNRGSALTWDYSSSSLMVTTVNSATMVPSPSSAGCVFLSRSPNHPLYRSFGVAPGSVSDPILRDALLGN
ncbi:hypothetical protein FRB91_002869 [Serendipita sp. 411]|nr:hypothetical protein FRB91_002869 [Serendipita sp. 411]